MSCNQLKNYKFHRALSVEFTPANQNNSFIFADTCNPMSTPFNAKVLFLNYAMSSKIINVIINTNEAPPIYIYIYICYFSIMLCPPKI